jgi:hypothetical protein
MSSHLQLVPQTWDIATTDSTSLYPLAASASHHPTLGRNATYPNRPSLGGHLRGSRGGSPEGRPSGTGVQVDFRPATGCGAAWLARLTGGQEVGGSSPPSPTLPSWGDRQPGVAPTRPTPPVPWTPVAEASRSNAGCRGAGAVSHPRPAVNARPAQRPFHGFASVGHEPLSS